MMLNAQCLDSFGPDHQKPGRIWQEDIGTAASSALQKQEGKMAAGGASEAALRQKSKNDASKAAKATAWRKNEEAAAKRKSDEAAAAVAKVATPAFQKCNETGAMNSEQQSDTRAAGLQGIKEGKTAAGALKLGKSKKAKGGACQREAPADQEKTAKYLVGDCDTNFSAAVCSRCF